MIINDGYKLKERLSIREHPSKLPTSLGLEWDLRCSVCSFLISVYETLFVFCLLSFYHCVVCPLIYGIWLRCLSIDLRYLVVPFGFTIALSVL